MTIPDCPTCGERKLNLPVLCNGAYHVEHYGKYYVKCPGCVSEEARSKGSIPTCTFFRWLDPEDAKAWIYENPEWEVHDHLQRREKRMQSTFRVSGVSGASGASSPWVYCSIEGCAKRGSKRCGFCTTHCHARMSPTVCGYHGYDPVNPRARTSTTASLSTAQTSASTPLSIEPPEGTENHEVFSRHIDENWGQHLINDGGYSVERRAPATPAALTLREAAAAATSRNATAEVVEPTVDRAKWRDREMADKERTIKVTVFVKDNEAAQYFIIAVLAKDWPIFSPKKYPIVARACGIPAGDLDFFQRYEDGLWVNHEEKVRVRKDESVILRLLGVQICEGYETRKRPRPSSTASDILVVEERPSPTKTLRTGQGRVATAHSTPPLALEASGKIRSIDDLINLSISDDDDLYAPMNSTQLGDTILPPLMGRELKDAKANTPRRGDENGWPFKFAVDQHESFLQVEKLLSSGKEMKVAEAFLKVVPQATRWVDTTWNKHYKAWKAIRDDEHHPLRKGLVRAIRAGRVSPKGNWAPFGPNS
ncbi:hypothetical protein ARMSODRAFT_1025839 [Armillaria solidipes]|uniref:Uncharacterized protein n=1 Tax=Armillaria solidipes TaxID=1076256 RepID=A0A2H3B2N5_9AGAR|nr:hypothetical protein ARMSODRAFT_1025839 [Armillaria solidipes]